MRELVLAEFVKGNYVRESCRRDTEAFTHIISLISSYYHAQRNAKDFSIRFMFTPQLSHIYLFKHSLGSASGLAAMRAV